MKASKSEKVFQFFNYLILTALAIVTLYPFWYVVVASLSEPAKLLQVGDILLRPVGFTLNAYKSVLKNPSIYSGYANTIFYVVAGSAVNMLMTSLAAYVLSRKGLMLKRFFTLMFIFTMYFSGGLIPKYLLMLDLNLLNNRLALIIPGAVSTYNLLILITGFGSVPDSLEESARIDGASHLRILFNIILPLAKPTMMVILMYYAVGHWNAWFDAMIYIRDGSKMPLQLYLRNILVLSQTAEMQGIDVEDIGTTVKYATIIVSTLPILCIYPFIQKHFVSGVMIGAVKE